MTRRTLRTALVLVAASLTGGVAYAQDGGGASPQEIEQKIREIERLMKKAEESLARSTGTRKAEESAEDAAKRLEELLQKKAQEAAGKSADELRKQAAEGSEEAAEALRRLMEEARAEAAKAGGEMERLLNGAGGSAGGAGEGVRRLLEETRRSGQEAREGIQWLLENAVTSGGGGGHQPEQRKPDQEQGRKPEPKDGEKDPDKPQNTAQKPESELDPPSSPEFEVWLADLPPQVRRAYESKDWDAIPPKWRAILRAWTQKMAKELEEGRR